MSLSRLYPTRGHTIWMGGLTACPRSQGLPSLRSATTINFGFGSSSLTTTCSPEVIVLETYNLCLTLSSQFTVRDVITRFLSRSTLSKSSLLNYLI
jgi:hypothetical protein